MATRASVVAVLTASVVSLTRFEEGCTSVPDCQVCGSAKNCDGELAWTLQLAFEGTATAEEVIVSNTLTIEWVITSRIATSQIRLRSHVVVLYVRDGTCCECIVDGMISPLWFR